jgi:DMSO reductase iron-sulfur subunit
LRSAFVFDPNRCTGCSACELACSIENDLGVDRSWRSVLTFNERGFPGIPVFHLSLACNHCETAACMEACPARAYERDPGTGAVLIRQDACIGCRYCAWACPYGAPRFEPDRGVMGKCTFCAHRLADSREPACAALCPTGALDFAMLPEGQLSDLIEGMPRTDLGPSIRVRPLDGRSISSDGRAVGVISPGSSEGQAQRALAAINSHPVPRIDLAGEWSLAAFTLLLAVMFSMLAADAVGGRPVPTALFAGVAASAAALSLAHLGRPLRAWRAILGFLRSPVSREVLGFGALASLGTLSLAWPEPAVAGPLGTAGLIAGLVALVSADQVYRPVYAPGSPLLHSGGVTVTGLYLGALAAGISWLAIPLGGFKLLRFVGRRGFREIGMTAGSMRIGLGLLLPAAAGAAAGLPLAPWILVLVAFGEAVDRAAFYVGLEIVSPASQMRKDLEARLTALPEAQSSGGPAIRSTASASSS